MPTRGVIDVRPSGALRARVDAGIDPVTGKRHRLVEHIPADTPNKAAVAEQVRIRLVNQVNERRHPRTSATVSQLLDRYLDNFDGVQHGTQLPEPAEESRGVVHRFRAGWCA